VVFIWDWHPAVIANPNNAIGTELARGDDMTKAYRMGFAGTTTV
jgi:hypothetical protein